MLKKIKKLVVRKGVWDLWKDIRLREVKRNIPKYLERVEGIDAFLLYNEQCDLKNYNKQPLICIPLQDFLGMLQSVREV